MPYYKEKYTMICLIFLTVVCIHHSIELCPEHYYKRGKYCYGHPGTKRTFDEAVANCIEGKGYLAEPMNHKELQLVTSVLSKDVNSIWIGATDRAQEGVWRWLSNGEEVRFTPWSNGHPVTGSEHEDCVELKSVLPSAKTDISSKAYVWKDVICGNQTSKRYVCQRLPYIWTACSTTCGKGTQERMEPCQSSTLGKDESYCKSQPQVSKECELQKCTDHVLITAVSACSFLALAAAVIITVCVIKQQRRSKVVMKL